MNSIYQSLIVSAIVLFVGIIFSYLGSRFVGIILRKISKRTKNQTDDYVVEILIKTIKPLGFVITSCVAWKLLPFGNDIDIIVLSIFKLIVLFLVVRLLNSIITKLIQSWSLKINDKSISTMLNSLSPMVRAGIWCIGAAIYLQNIGVQMAAIWALLSAGGIGAGLALKEPVQEFFEYITILLDKPFQNGEFINVGGVWATVERVGVRSTRLRSLNGEVIVMNNSSLTNGVISNYTEMNSRRLVHKIGVTYDTDVNNIEKIPNMIKDIIDNTHDARFDRCHFTDFGDFSLNFELVYYIPTNNYFAAMEAQQNINLKIMEEFKLNNIEFAFPTQTLQIDRGNSK